MHQFKTKLVPGKKRPYNSWTFLVIPPPVAKDLGSGRKEVRISISGHTLRGTAARGEGALRVPLSQAFRDEAQVSCGDTVDVTLELDSAPRPLPLPAELRAVFKEDPKIAKLYESLPPSMRRAWATYIADAKQPETRLRRAAKASNGIRARTFPG